MYSIIRFLLFRMDAEKAHALALGLLNWLGNLKILPGKIEQRPLTVMGIEFPNRLGLAAGLDKNGDYLNGLSAIGFGFIEIGTVTPRPQPGNPLPRLFRLPRSEAIINRMGFNNKGVDHLLKQLQKFKKQQPGYIIGVNIGKNFDTTLENANSDYLLAMQKVYAHADYITLNISSPNTPGLRDLQFGSQLQDLLAAVKQQQQVLQQQHGKYVPLVVKIAPDMDEQQTILIARYLMEHAIDGVIATNTTIARNDLNADETYADQAGGLSGRPLMQASTEIVKILARELKGKIPIIAAGGIFSAADAQQKLNAGASLVQIYSGFIYKGLKLVRECSQIK